MTPAAAATTFTRADAVTTALVRALEYLERTQQADGMWADYQLVSGQGTTWITAYVGCCLTTVPEQPRLEHMLGRARQALLAQTAPPAGWGYNPRVLADSDSTALALRFLADGAGAPAALVQSAWALLQANQNPDGGMATYGARLLDRFLQRTGAKASVESFVGWTASHLSVTAATLWAGANWALPESGPDFSQAAYYLLAGQERDGLWHDYWWVGPYYVTNMALWALHRLGVDWGPQARATVQALAALQEPDGGWGGRPGESDPFATALAVSSMLLPAGADPALSDRGVDWLLKAQRPDGSFKPSALMRLPPPFIAQANPGEGARPGSIHLDDNANFTTATVVQTLAAYLKKEGQSR